ncbi:hypothetical protein JTE90_027988 [Oedothorax gibbosus]|uniref:Prohibitin n=1 Tax=Oedothorax gibbosus TaxID=931172 RepID=A0AAV6TPB9_9ARAC|nr:hypothetical protein JTE90_027988 [Oedothorax gibbosus]
MGENFTMAAQLFNNISRLSLGLVIVGGVNSALYTVDCGQRAVIFDKFAGVKPNVIGEGTHFLIPWVQRPIIFDIRSRLRKISVKTSTKDLKTAHVKLWILFRPVETELPKICTTLGYDYEEKVLPSISTKVLKAVVAQFDASEMITKRKLIKQKVCEELIERGSQIGLVLDVSIVRNNLIVDK